MNDKNTLNLARVFAESVESRPSAYDEQVRAAAALISSLPDDLEDLLPAPPAPRTLSDMAPEERAGCQWMQADLKGDRIIIGAIADGGVNYIKHDGKAYWDSLGSGAGEIVPLPDLPRMEWPGSEPEDDVASATGGELTTQGVVDECRAVRKERATSESASPRPEDVPVGEPWHVEVEGRTAIGYRADPETRLCWAVVYPHHTGRHWMYDSDVTLIARLVPETTEQEHGEAPCLLDKDGDHWVKVGGQWKMVDPDFGYDELPEPHGPYRSYF